MIFCNDLYDLNVNSNVIEVYLLRTYQYKKSRILTLLPEYQRSQYFHQHSHLQAPYR